MIQYALPDFTRRISINLMIARMMHTAPEMFYDDIKIDCLYGCFPDCAMNGGRLIKGDRYSYDKIVETFDAIENEGLGIRLTFTNMLLKAENFKDKYANDILKAAQGRNAKVIVWSDELGKYISDHYHLELILSTTRKLEGIEELNKMLDRYNMVVLDYNHNKNDAFLSKVKTPSRLELIANEMCRPNCMSRYRHYEEDSRRQLEHTPASFHCPGGCEGIDYTTRTKESPTILGNDDVRRLYKTYGISHYKITGRNATDLWLFVTYLYYLVRPEYRTVMAKIIQKQNRKD